MREALLNGIIYFIRNIDGREIDELSGLSQLLDLFHLDSVLDKRAWGLSNTRVFSSNPSLSPDFCSSFLSFFYHIFHLDPLKEGLSLGWQCSIELTPTICGRDGGLLRRHRMCVSCALRVARLMSIFFFIVLLLGGFGKDCLASLSRIGFVLPI